MHNLGVGTAPQEARTVEHQPQHGHVAHQFDDAVQQHEAATLGMWAFLATEVLFFGGLFTAYAVYRYRSDQAFALGSHQLKMWLGALNTAVLLCSSLTMAMAVRASHRNEPKPLGRYLMTTCALGVAFLGIKAVEWTQDYHEGLVPQIRWGERYWTGKEGDERKDRISEATKGTDVSDNFLISRIELFFVFYFIMTGLHGLHMLIGALLVGGLIVLTLRGRYNIGHANLVEMIGLYWHFVDIVWIFLFPLLYLVK